MRKYICSFILFLLGTLLSSCEFTPTRSQNNTGTTTPCKKLSTKECATAITRCLPVNNGQCEDLISGSSCSDFDASQFQCQLNVLCQYNLSLNKCQLIPINTYSCTDALTIAECNNASARNPSLSCKWQGGCMNLSDATALENSMTSAFEAFLTDPVNAAKGIDFSNKFAAAVKDEAGADEFMLKTFNNNKYAVAELFRNINQQAAFATIVELFRLKPSNWANIDSLSGLGTDRKIPLKLLLDNRADTNFPHVLSLAIKAGADISKLPSALNIDHIIGHISTLGNANNLLKTTYIRSHNTQEMNAWIEYAYSNDLTNFQKLAKALDNNPHQMILLGNLLTIAADKAKAAALLQADYTFNSRTNYYIKKFLDLFDSSLFADLSTAVYDGTDNALTVTIKRFIEGAETITNPKIVKLAKLTALKIKYKTDLSGNEWVFYIRNSRDIIRTVARGLGNSIFYPPLLEWKKKLENMSSKIAQFDAPGQINNRNQDWPARIIVNKTNLENWFKANTHWEVQLRENTANRATGAQIYKIHPTNENVLFFELSETTLNNISPTLPKNILFKVQRGGETRLSDTFVKNNILQAAIHANPGNFNRLIVPHQINLDVNIGTDIYHIYATEKIDLYSDGNPYDNKLLYMYLLTKEHLNDTVKQQYLHTLRAACRANFGDLKFDNLPFSANGQGYVVLDMSSAFNPTKLFNRLPHFFTVNNDHTLDTTYEVLQACNASGIAQVPPTRAQKSKSQEIQSFYEDVFNMWEDKKVSTGDEQVDLNTISTSTNFNYIGNHYQILSIIVQKLNNTIAAGSILEKRCLKNEISAAEINTTNPHLDIPAIEKVIKDLKDHKIIVSVEYDNDSIIPLNSCF